MDGRLGEVVQDLDRAIQLALAEGPRAVVRNLSGVLDGPEPGSVEVLATAGRHVRDWPAIPEVGRLRLSPHPTAPRASRDFVTRTRVVDFHPQSLPDQSSGPDASRPWRIPLTLWLTVGMRPA